MATLATIGMDVGQMAHSVHTHACDASGAMWWMLKRKADEREAEQKELRSPTAERRNRASATPTLLSRRQTSRPSSSLADAPMPSPIRRSPTPPKRSRSPSPPRSPDSPTVSRSAKPVMPTPSLIASVSAPTLAGYFSPSSSVEAVDHSAPYTSTTINIIASPSIGSEIGSPSLDAGEATAKAKRQVRLLPCSI